MTDSPPLAQASGSPGECAPSKDTGWWTRARAFWVTSALLAALLLGLIPLLDNNNIAVPDDGVYAAQAELLTLGGWSGYRPAPAIDTDGFNSCINPDVVVGDRQIPYSKHPLLPSLLAPLRSTTGFGGMIGFSVSGTWLAAVAAGLMARRLDRRYGIPALLLAGIGSPLVFDAYLVSGHAMAAGLFGVVALGLTCCVDDGRWWALAFTLPCAAAVVALRSEGAVAMMAGVTVLVVSSLHVASGPSPRLRMRWAEGVIAAGLLVTSVAAFVLDRQWSKSIREALGPTKTSLLANLPTQRDPLGSAWASLMRSGEVYVDTAVPAAAFAAAAMIIAAVAMKVVPRRWLLPVTLLVAAATGLVAQIPTQPHLVTGLLPAFPVMASGLVLLSRSDFKRPLVARNLAIALLTAVGVTATAYGFGGSTEWGGRFYHLVIPLIVPAVVVGLHRGQSALPRVPAFVATAAVTVAVLATSVLGLRYISYSRAEYRNLTTSVSDFVHDNRAQVDAVSEPTRSIVVFSTIGVKGDGRAFWRTSDELDVICGWDIFDGMKLIDRARREDAEITVITDYPPKEVGVFDPSGSDRSPWGARRREAVPGTDFVLMEMGPRSVR